MNRILVTGPSEALAEYARAARDAGWQPIELPLITIVERDVDPDALLAGEPPFDWLVVASSSALPFVGRVIAAHRELSRARFACVGARTAERARGLDLACAGEPAESGSALAFALTAREAAPRRALWPRGDRSDEIARILREAGWTVVDPIVYDTRDVALRELPAAEAVFLASPSAVRALFNSGLATLPGHAIAIGPSTFDAITSDPDARFASIAVLAEPTPAALEHLLRHSGARGDAVA